MTGATGVIGRRTLPLLIDAGHHVTAAGRTPESRASLSDAGATAIDVDLFDRSGVERAASGHDVVINLATHMPTSSLRMMMPWFWHENDRIRREGARNIADAVIAGHVGRLIQESFAPVYPDRGSEWIDESTPIEPVSYNRTVLDAERAALSVTETGSVGVVLRFAAFYGPDSFALHDMAKMVRHGWSPLPGAPEAYISSVSHDDAAAAVVAALDLPAGIYNVADDEPLWRKDYLDAFAAALGVKRPRSLPKWTTRLMGSVGELLSRSERIANQKLRTAAPQWVPRFHSAREGLAEALRPH